MESSDFATFLPFQVQEVNDHCSLGGLMWPRNVQCFSFFLLETGPRKVYQSSPPVSS